MNDLLILCSHLQLLRNYGSNLSAEDQNIKWRSIKFLIIILRMVEELQINWRKLMSNRLDQFCPLLISICENFTVSLLPIMVIENICLSSSANFIEVSIDISEKKTIVVITAGGTCGVCQIGVSPFAVSRCDRRD